MAETRPWVLASPDYQDFRRLVLLYVQEKQILESLYDKDRVRQNHLEKLLAYAALQKNDQTMTRLQNEIDTIESNRQAAIQQSQTVVEDLVLKMANSEYQRKRFGDNRFNFLQYY